MPAMESDPGKCPAKILLHANSDYVILARQRADKERHLLSQALPSDIYCHKIVTGFILPPSKSRTFFIKQKAQRFIHPLGGVVPKPAWQVLKCQNRAALHSATAESGEIWVGR